MDRIEQINYNIDEAIDCMKTLLRYDDRWRRVEGVKKLLNASLNHHQEIINDIEYLSRSNSQWEYILRCNFNEARSACWRARNVFMEKYEKTSSDERCVSENLKKSIEYLQEGKERISRL